MPTTLPFWQQAAEAVGAVKKILLLPCAASTMLYVETGAEAALQALLSYAAPDAKELYHKAAGESLLCSIKSELVGQGILPSADENLGTRFLFDLGELADLSLWYLFLADIAAKGLMNWQSQLYQMSGCNHPGQATSASGSGYTGAIGEGGDWEGLDFAFVDGTGYSFASPCSTTIYPGQTGICTASVQFHKWLTDIPVNTASRVADISTGVVYDYDNNTTANQSNPRRTHVFAQVKNEGDAPMTLECQFQCLEPDLPEHQAFPNFDTEFAYFYNPNR